MNLIPIQNQNDVVEASRLFSQIDSSISFMFTANHTNALSSYLISDFDIGGAYCCYTSDAKAYIYIAFEKENHASSFLVSKLCHIDFLSLNGCPIEVWIKQENGITIQRLKQEFLCDEVEYGMTEFVMERSAFSEASMSPEITVNGFQPLYFQAYLSLLDSAMTYHNTADFYSARADEYKRDFLDGDKKGYFKTFWINATLLGLYLRDWKSGDDLALLAINKNYQRKGYGSMLLRHAANSLFTTTTKNHMYLYCMDHNIAAKSFYLKQGMKISGHSHKMTILGIRME